MRTKNEIIKAALTVLKEQGTEGLTLRKVASRARISLGNLQYHYRNKTALFSGLAEHYFGECSEILQSYEPLGPQVDRSIGLRHLIEFILDHLDHLTDMCRIFRELWALATRDAAISGLLVDYYQSSRREMKSLFLQITSSPTGSERIVTLLLPYFEGYSITHEAFDQDKEAIAELLSQIALSLLD